MELHLPNFVPQRNDLILGRVGFFPFYLPFRLRQRQRLTHMYVLGVTGQGKSKLLEHCLFQDITAGRGCGLIDPHTDLVNDLLANLLASGFFKQWKNRRRVVYFDPARSDYQIPFNVLSGSDPPYTIAINVVEAFRRTWPESLREAPRFTNVLLASLLVLIANRLTLVELPRLLTDKPFREGLLDEVNDEEITAVFHDRLDRWGREQPLMLESILNKVSAFTLNPTLRLILGQTPSRLDFREIMDEGKVFIADLGRLDGETRRLLGNLITTGIEQAALSRKDEKARQRLPFYFYIDEFQDFSAGEGSAMTLSQILSEARKFGLHLTLAHQTLGQVTNDRMRSVLGNIGTKVVFAVDRVDAEIMTKKLFWVGSERIKHEVEDEYQQEKSHPLYYSLQEEWEKAIQSVQNLPPRTCLVKVPQRNVARIKTIPIPKYNSSDGLDALEKELAQQVGEPCSLMQKEIAQRRDGGKKPLITDYEPVNRKPPQKDAVGFRAE